jgi:hypothetical protein
MHTLTLHPETSAQNVTACREPRVFVDNHRRYDLHVLSWDIETAPAFGLVRLASETHDADALPSPGCRVCIQSPTGGPLAAFHGVVARHQHRPQTSPTWIAEVQHQLATFLQMPLVGRWHATADGPTWSEGSPTRFNISPGLRASRCVFTLNGRATRLFADAPAEAQPWTLADAITYLLALALPPNIHTPTPQELVELGLNRPLDPYNADAVLAGHALVEIARRGGVAWRAARGELGLVTYRPGKDGRRSKLRLQWPGERLDTRKTNVQAADIDISQRPARRPLRITGNTKRYEATFSLQPGWDPVLAAGVYEDYVRSGGGDFTSVEPVFRKWVLNEHGGYDAPPVSAARYDAAELSPEDFVHAGPRRFLPCLSRNAAGESYGMVVEYRLSSSDAWRQWGGAVWASDEECSIFFDDDTLDADYLAATAAGTAEVRITASIEADRCLEYNLPGDRGLHVDVRRAPSGEHWTVDPSSRFFADIPHAGGSASAVIRDDLPRLISLARRIRNAEPAGLQASLKLPWPDLLQHPGDCVGEILGRALPLTTQPDRDAVVTRVRHSFTDDAHTLLELEA